ncbi:LytR/AlgR family response regulator transcription factor [Methyloradius palustris]|uniref:DNA-binding response regulator n=1 Tax=Methyloradius palustris TaxID=2778876 RepID=A0A8D5G0A0_9PROT|nr:LytTR family DNA-binding domain-containing protein [Methyloradius palustris]BCM23783.1 DNA-binding response regulator [Methyloradius palustris]
MNQSDTVRILIADDEAPARNRLRELLGDIANLNIIGEAKNGKEVLELVAETPVDIVLLDIRMPQMDGIEAAEHLQKVSPPPAIIFTTAFDAYALQAFDMNAVDYLLKPIRVERLQTAINKARALLPAQLTAIKPLQPKRNFFSVHERGRVLLVPVADVIYMRAELKYTTLRTRDREFLIEDSLTSLEQEFSEQFLRLHRNCLVAKDAILGYEKRTIEGEQRWVALLKNLTETVAVSRRQMHVLKELGN